MVRRTRRSSKRGGKPPPGGLTLRKPPGGVDIISPTEEARLEKEIEEGSDKLYGPGGPFAPPPAKFIGPFNKPPGPNTNGLKPTGAPKGGRSRTRRRHPRRKTSRR